MRVGLLREKVIIQQNTPTRDSFGDEVDSWGTFATVWASIEPLKGREFWDAQQVNAEVTHRMRIRYLPGITPKMRVSWDNRVFNIKSVINLLERNKEMELILVEEV